MSTIVAFATRKGGVGKSTCAIGFAAVAAAAKRKTLLIDLDQEGHASFGIGAEVAMQGSATTENCSGSADFLLGKACAVQQISPLLDVLVGNSDLEDPAIGRLEPESLSDAIATLRDKYDVIVIDCPPNSHELSKLGIVAAQSVFVPIDAHPYALNCAQRIVTDLEARKTKRRSGASRWAIIANRIDTRRRADSDVITAVHSLFAGIPIFKIAQDTAHSNASTRRELITKIPKNTKAIKELSILLSWADKATN